MYIHLQILLFDFLYEKKLFETVLSMYLFFLIFEVPNNIVLVKNDDVGTDVEIYGCHRRSWYNIPSRNVHFTKYINRHKRAKDAIHKDEVAGSHKTDRGNSLESRPMKGCH